jgi:hypothetical protein
MLIPFAYSQRVVEAMRSGAVIGEFQASQQVTTMAS